MLQYCTACDQPLNLIVSNEDEHGWITCDCGVLNQIDYVLSTHKRQLNIALIKSKMSEKLEKHPLFKNIDRQVKDEIISHASKVGTHISSSLKCFALVYIESRNLISFDSEYIIKKRQRKNAIQILVNISPNEPTIFVRTPITYKNTYSHLYDEEEKQTYIDISECLLFMNACNKKDMQSIYEKIHSAIIESRNKQSQIKTTSLNDIIRFIAINRLKVEDLIKAEQVMINRSILSFK